MQILEDGITNNLEHSEVYKMLYCKAYGEHLSRETCEQWVRSMEVKDGSGRNSGEKWSIEQTTEVGSKLGVNWSKMNKYEWYAGMNAFYSDFYRTSKKYELDGEPQFFGDLVLV